MILPIQHFSEMATQRNHTLISVSNPRVPGQGNLTIFCNTCEQEFTTSAHSYRNARRSGCPNCRSINARLPQPRPEQNRLTAEEVNRRRELARQASSERRNRQSAYGWKIRLQTRESINQTNVERLD